MKLVRLLTVALALPVASRAHAQDAQDRWRSFDVSRQLHDTLPQRIRVQYGAGKVDVRATDANLLYGMHLRYDELRAAPVHRYDAEQRSTVLGLEPRHGINAGSRESESGELKVLLPSRIPLDLELEFGGTEATLELGGLALQSVRLECGATDATLGFTLPNRTHMRELDVSVGAAGFTALHLANANADVIRVRGGVGVVDLDFSGSWTRDLAVESRVAIGKLVLRVPVDVGVRVEVQRVAADFDHEGLVKKDDAWYSRNWDSAAHKLRIHAATVIGGISVERSTR